MLISRPSIEVIDNIPLGYIAESPIHGYGLFAAQNLKKGELIGVLDGQEVDWDYYHRLKDSVELDEYHKNLFFFEWNAVSGHKLLARSYQTKYSYINHSLTPNLILSPRFKYIKIVTLRDIEMDEELLLNYLAEPLSDEYLLGHGATYLEKKPEKRPAV